MIEIKVGKNLYQINDKDRFMDNGSCVQLMSQSQEKPCWGHRPSPILSKKLYKQLCVKYAKVNIEYGDNDMNLSVFSFKVDNNG